MVAIRIVFKFDSNILDYQTFEDEESSLEIELVPKNPIPEKPPSFSIKPDFSTRLIVDIFCVILYTMYL
ncbi:unnamed protein product (macronuclear) [Paramecium tetraurelia]|uniref:Uncharacterized protein n=1 Tax=Paramecium tetraurelia TaxID=5888 RepID=A0CUV3_PARTE|nr:uncharacterized protein GSPATT00039025001 [Paramecium tetraurelia]CAK74570.1 unnamed protein product [Paramecium tetraurelia]|eukprot:XP_001441967.1 hypothetical protein (macronuclear) [Paramecium tetraurelia strain d4-2]